MLDRVFSNGDSERIIVHNPRIDIILEEIDSADDILDIGCVQHSAKKENRGDHWLHGELQDYANSVIGLDYLEEEVKKLDEKGYNVVCANAEDFDLGRTFDTIVAGELIEHLSNPGQFLDCVYEHLRPGGRLLLTTPNPWYIRRFFEALLLGEVHVNPEHTCWFDERTLTEILSRQGLRLKSFQYASAPRFKATLSLESIDASITRTVRRIGFDTLTGYSIVAVATK